MRVTPAIEIRQEFDSNIGYREDDVESDVVTAVTPTVEFSYEGDRGHARARLGVRSRSYWDHSELNSIDRFGRFEVERLLTPRLAVFSKGIFEVFPDRDPAFDGGQELVGGRPDYTHRDLSAGVRYVLDPLSALTFAAGFSGEDFDQGDLTDRSFSRRDRESRYALVSYTRQLSERDEVGLKVSFSDDSFDQVELVTGEETDRTAQARLHWSRAWTPQWSTRVGAGARSVRIDEDSVPGLVVSPTSGLDLSPSETSLGFIGDFEVERSTKRTVTTLGFNKETRPSSGYGSTVDTDTVSASFTARLTQRLQLNLSGYVQRYESVGESLAVLPPIVITWPFFATGCPSELEAGVLNGGLRCVGLTDNELDATVLGGRVQLGWRVNRQWSTFLRYTYRSQNSRGDRPVSEFTNYRVIMGFHYEVPIDLF
jgi:hypothetical protein